MTNFVRGRSHSDLEEKGSRTSSLPRYKYYDADSDTDEEPDLERLTLDWHKSGSRPGSLLRTKLVIGIDFGTT